MRNRIEPDHFYDLIDIAGPDLSPNGMLVAFARGKASRSDHKVHSRIQVLEVETGRIESMTHGEQDSTPRWSTDGTRLAFLRKDENEKDQIWVFPKGMGEPERLTSTPLGVSDYAWSPKGERIAFQSLTDPHDTGEAEGPATIHVRTLRYKADGFGVRSSRSQIFTVDVDDQEVRQLTSGDFDSYAPTWSPEGNKIAFISVRHENREIEARSEAYVLTVETGHLECWTEDLFAIGGLTWNPDGTGLAVIGVPERTDGGGFSLSCQSWIYQVNRGHNARRLTDDTIYPVTSSHAIWPYAPITWLPGGIWFQGDARGESFLCQLDPSTGELIRATGGGEQFSSWSTTASGARAVVVSSSAKNAHKMSVFDLPQSRVARSVNLNREWFEEHPSASIERFSYSRNGMDLDARLYLPPDFDASKRYPLVLDVHGGPHSCFYDTFYPLHQIPASAGYLVLAINPRGSSTYGQDFASAVHGDWCGGPYEDLMAGVDMVAERLYVDEDQLFMHGSSYGGYMGCWIAGHTNRFRAIVVGAPVTDLLSFYGTSDIGVHFSEAQLIGGRFDGFDEYLRQSPITYAPQVETPLLILHGEADDRVPIAQGEQFFAALRRLGKEVAFVRLPGSAHGLFRNPDLRMRAAYFELMLDWFDKHKYRPGNPIPNQE